ncbi:hypothetical protein THII_2236 [Thioploca ingrica]|uniref:Uncharacterized protein n=1 Tax=Thioploca ingrica TaxID=40754 RepID=A0A090AET3_9GAMM|nr:hypothetical protein THII_2236 [Thioploca ingrica]
MTEPVALTIQDLLAGIYHDRSLAHEVLHKLPFLITEEGDVIPTTHCNNPYNIIKK